jgi:hypothetical protein
MIIFLFILNIKINATAESCEEWFLRNHVVPNTKTCESECASKMVGMDTFTCTSDCENLCKTKLPAKAVAALSYMKGINEGDKVVIAKYPKEAIKVYMAKNKADELTQKLFGKEGRNDESDAFRHFVWAGLLVKEIGEEKSRIFLTAHEQDPNQPIDEKNMDMTNNEKGIAFFKSAQKTNKALDLDSLEKQALDELKSGGLKVLSPSNKKLPEGYYSK